MTCMHLSRWSWITSWSTSLEGRYFHRHFSPNTPTHSCVLFNLLFVFFLFLFFSFFFFKKKGNS
jgi:hypothetical protein